MGGIVVHCAKRFTPTKTVSKCIAKPFMALKNISNVDYAMLLFGPRHIFESILVRNILREVRNYVKPTAYESTNPVAAAENIYKPTWPSSSSSFYDEKKSKQIFVYILQNCITTAPPPAVLAEVEAKIIQLQFNNYLLLSHLLNVMVWIFPPIPTMMMP